MVTDTLLWKSNATRLLVVALATVLSIAPTSASAQSRARQRKARHDRNTNGQTDPDQSLDGGLALDGRLALSFFGPLELGSNVRGLAFLNLAGVGTINNRVGSLSIANPTIATGWPYPGFGSSSLPSSVILPRRSGPDSPTNDTFTNGAGTGLWSNAGNWSAGVPGSTNNVLVTGTGSASSVTEDISDTINNLTLNSGNSWTLDNGQGLTIDGNSISNAGNMTLNSGGNTTELVINNAAVTLNGGGTLTLSNNASNFIFGQVGTDTLTNQETIQGAGDIGNGQMTLVNSGTIDANQSAGLTVNPNGGVTNTGTIEATGGKLFLLNTTVTNTGGTITDSGQTLGLQTATVNGGAVALTGAATLQLNNSTIHGGSTLTNSATGTIEVLANTNTLGGTITNPAGGLVKVDNGAVLDLEGGSYPALGAVQLNSSGNLTELVVAGSNVTLSGGTVTLSNNANNFVFGAAGTDTLTNQETIQGAGDIGNGQMTLVNSGTIDANQSAGLTVNPNGGVTNTGTIEATGGKLFLLNTTVTNTGGTITDSGQTLGLQTATVNGGAVALTGAATLQLNNSTIHGGSTLTNSATGTIEVLANTNTLGGTITNPAGGLVKVDNGAVLDLEGGSYPALGAVQLNSSGNLTELVVAGSNVTLSGGTVTLSNNANNFVFGAAGTDTLTNQETIQGAGDIGNGQMTLVNSGTIDANQSAGLTVNPNGGVTNTGTIEATGGKLFLLNTTVTNTGGTITDSGQTLGLQTATVNGGAVALTGAATLQLNNSTIHGGSTLTNSATGTIEVLANTNTLGGTITNPAGGLVKVDNGAVLDLEGGSYPALGAVQLNSSGNLTELVVAGSNVTLSGGTVTLSNNANNFVFGAAGTDTLTNQETIQGAGDIGNGQMTLVNSGTIDANQSAGLTVNPNGGVTNTGTIEATGGKLFLLNTTVTNTGGTITDSGQTLGLQTATVNGGAVALTGAATLQLNNSTIHGGSTLTNSATGTIEVLANTNTLGGTITNPAGGLVKVDNGAVLDLEGGSYPALGAVQLNSSGNLTELVVAGSNVTLSGGTVTLSNNANNFVFGAAGTDTLTNQETIQGAGDIGNGQMTLVNSGTIDANQSAGLTVNPNGGVTNTGTIEATGGKLFLLNTTVTNTGGTITDSGQTLGLQTATVNGGAVALTGAATLQLNNSTIHGGSTLTNSATGTIEVLANTNTLGGTITNPAGGLVKVDNGAVLDLEGGSYPALGAVQLNSSGNLTELVVAGSNVTLSGGTVTLSNNANNFVFGAAGTDTLTNQETIQGAGDIGNGQMTLVNSGTIDANQSAGLTVNPNGGVTNTGTIEATGGKLFLLNTTVTNTGGTITDSGQTLGLQTATVNGGAVALTGAATLQLNNSTIHGGSTLTNSATGTIEVLANTNTLGGTITNPAGGLVKVDNGAVLDLEGGSYPALGAVQLNSSGNLTELVVAGSNVTLSGGTVTLSNNANNFVFGAAGTDTLTNQETIQGAGNIGNGQLGVINSSGGTILANQSTTLFIDTSSTGLNNQGTLQANAGSTLEIEGALANFLNYSGASQTLTGGTYIAAGTVEFPTGTVIATNAATLELSGSGTFTNIGGVNPLATFATNASTGTFSVQGGAKFTTPGNFTNNGTLIAGASSTFDVNGNLTNISGSTITGGTYLLTGVLKANNASGITTDSANITLAGSGALENQTGTNALTGLKTVSSKSSFTLNGGASFTTPGAFTNNGTLTVAGSGSKFISVANYASAGATKLQTGGTFDQTKSGTFSGSGTLTNAATLEATGGAVLDLKASVTNSGGTILATGSGSQILLDGDTVTGGTLSSASGGVLVGENSATLNGSPGAVTLSTGSTLNINNGQKLDAKGTLTNNGTLALNSTSTNTELVLSGNLTLGGTGKLTLSNKATNIITATANTDVLTNSSTIQGSGNIGNGMMGLVNNKSITANQTTPLTIDTSTQKGFKNNGTLTVNTGDTLDLTGGAFQNLSGTTLAGGTYSVSGALKYNSTSDIATNSANITLTGSAAQILDSNSHNALGGLSTNSSTGTLTLAGGQSLTDTATAFSNAGTLTVASGSKLNLSGATATYTQTAGTTTVDNSLVANGGITISGGSVFGKSGTLTVGTSTVSNSGIFNIGDTLMTAATESVSGKYTQTSSGTLNIDIGGITAGTQFDQFVISSTATLNGTLNLDLINGFAPTLTDTFEILTASSVVGTFSTVNTPTFNGDEFAVMYNSNNVTLDVVKKPAAPSSLASSAPLLPQPTSSSVGFVTSNLPHSGPNPSPEPASLLLLGSGLLGVAGYARRRAASRKQR